MKMSRRARRMERHHLRAKRVPGFNLVALMDIFTILVFFLLVNSTDVQEIPSTRAVELPESVAETVPREALIVTVAQDAILVAGRQVSTVAEAEQSEGLVIETLRVALEQHGRRGLLRREDDEDLGAITIMGDRQIPFSLLKKVMATCTEAGFSQVSLAVHQTTQSAGGGS